MSQEQKMELKKHLTQLERRLRPLEWDFNRNQINEFRQKELERLKKEHTQCLEELNGLEQQ